MAHLRDGVIVPTDVTELYTESLENRKSVTIIEAVCADGREPLPPFVIAPGKHIMDNWITDELQGGEYITCSDTGYTNNSIFMEYLDRVIKCTNAGSDQPWKLLFLDGHESHHFILFKLKAAEHNIKLFYFPSHLTHALQPLDVGIFRPWKHWHNAAVQRAVRSLDFEYTVTSFFRDLVRIRKETMKPDTIIHAFEESGCWPVSAEQGIKKMRSYSKRQSTATDATDLLDLPALPPTPAEEIAKLKKAQRALALAMSRYTADIKTKGIQARKDEKARKLRLRDVELAGGLVDLLDLIPIREPDKHPTVADMLFMTAEGYPSLLNNLRELQQEEML